MKLVVKAVALACAMTAAVAYADAPLVRISAGASSLPEPGSLALFALAMLGVWAVKRGSDGRKK
jgi:hypothetical protein